MYPQEAGFATLGEIHDAALANLPGDVADFLEGGAGGESTLRGTRAAFERWAVRPRPMSGVGTPCTQTTFLGIPLALPLLSAPFGGDGLFDIDGHLAVARANAAAGIASIVPEAGTYSYEDVARAAPPAARIAQLHPIEHMSLQADRVRAAGYDALCITVDCPTAGFRTRNRRNRFDPDLEHFAGNFRGAGTLGVAEMFSRLVRHDDAPPWTWARLARAAADFGLPWFAKGILTGEAADAAIAAGAAENRTRFILVGRPGRGVAPRTGRDKTTIVCFQHADRPGSLHSILEQFAIRDLNVTKLESRPTKAHLGDYCFAIDVDGHIDDDPVADCLASLARQLPRVKFLGSYPCADPPAPARAEHGRRSSTQVGRGGLC